MLDREFGRGKHVQPILPGTPSESAKAQLVDAVRGIEQNATAYGQALEQVDLLEQRRILDDQCVWLQHRLADADLLVIDAAERHDRRTHAFRSEAGKRLRVFPL